VREIYTLVRYENGEEVSRTEDGSAVVQEPVNQVIAYGTNIVIRTVDTPEGPREYWRTFRVYATSYHPAALGGDNVTAIGMTLQKGVIGADPDIIPFRTDVYVPGYGTGIIADTGGPRSSPYWIDLGYSDEDWVSWSRYVDIYLLTPVPGDIDYFLPNWTPLRGH
jgi:3D (Asp-Asp-Asp) domain-containing protein